MRGRARDRRRCHGIDGPISKTSLGGTGAVLDPVCEKREGPTRRSGTLHLAPALSNRGRRGRITGFRNADGLVRRLVAREPTLGFGHDAEQRLWRTAAEVPVDAASGAAAEPRGVSPGRGPYQVV